MNNLKGQVEEVDLMRDAQKEQSEKMRGDPEQHGMWELREFEERIVTVSNAAQKSSYSNIIEECCFFHL